MSSAALRPRTLSTPPLGDTPDITAALVRPDHPTSAVPPATAINSSKAGRRCSDSRFKAYAPNERCRGRPGSEPGTYGGGTPPRLSGPRVNRRLTLFNGLGHRCLPATFGSVSSSRFLPRSLGSGRRHYGAGATRDAGGVKVLAHKPPERVALLRDFLRSHCEFAVRAAGRNQLRMEYFNRDMRRRTGLLMDGDQPGRRLIGGTLTSVPSAARSSLASGVSI
jgi:hypothetical protein